MSLLFMDSTDMVTTEYMSGQQWSVLSGPHCKWGYRQSGTGSEWRILASNPQFPPLWGGGKHSLQVIPGFGYNGLGGALLSAFANSINNPAGPDTIYAGMRIKYPLGIPAGSEVFFQFCNFHSTGQFMNGPGMFISSTGRIGACPGWAPGTVWAQTGTGVIASNTEYYVEYKVVATTGGTGSVEIRVNNSVVTSASGLTTLYPGLAGANTMRMVMMYANAHALLARDFYICDSQGSRNNTYLGDTNMGVLLPNADGFYHEWQPNGLHYPILADQAPDQTVIISPVGTTPPKRDSCIFNPPQFTGGRVAGVSVLLCSPGGYGGGSPLVPFLRIGGTNYEAPQRNVANFGNGVRFWGGRLDQIIGGTHFFVAEHHYIWETNPATGTDWTYSDLTSLEAGVRTVADDDNVITQLLIETTLPGSSYTPPADVGYGYAAVIGAGDTGVQGLSPAGLTEGSNAVMSAISGDAGPPATSATVQEDT